MENQNLVQTQNTVHEIAEKTILAIQQKHKELTNLNVIVLGKTGVGKSTLINSMFNENLADTGVGKPITQEIRRLTLENFPLCIYDTPGLELSGENATKQLTNSVSKLIEDGVASGELSKAIHCIWYCVSAPSHRFEKTEIELIRDFNEKIGKYDIPVIVVLTQSYNKKEALALKNEIERENLPIVNIVPVLAEDVIIDDLFTIPAYGLETLSNVMNNALPEGVKNTFAAVQKANLEIKKKKAQTAVVYSAAAAAATGAIPLPFSDVALLVPEQIGMIASISAIFGLSIEKNMISTIVSSTIGTAGTTVLGKVIVTNLLKIIPGASIAASVVSASTAAALTAALGEAYIAIMIKVYQGEIKAAELSTEKGKAEIAEIFKTRLKLKRNDKGVVIGEDTL